MSPGAEDLDSFKTTFTHLLNLILSNRQHNTLTRPLPCSLLLLLMRLGKLLPPCGSVQQTARLEVGLLVKGNVRNSRVASGIAAISAMRQVKTV